MGTLQPVIVPASINHDGAQDVSGDVQNILNNAPSGSEVRFQAGGIYRMEFTPEVKKPLDINMNGSQFKSTVLKPYGNATVNTDLWRANRNRANIRFIGNWHGGRLRAGTLRGCQQYAWDDTNAYNSNLEGQHGIDIQGAQDIEVDHVDIKTVWGDFIAVATGLGGARPTNIYCHDFTGDGNGRQGISVSVGSDVKFEHYNIKNMRRAVYDIELDTNSALVERVTFGGTGLDDVFIGAHQLNFLSCADGTLGTVGAVTVRGHQFSSASPTSVMQMTLTGGDTSHRRGPYTIVDNAGPNAFGTPLGGLIRMQYVNGATVQRNAHPLKTGGVWPDGNVMYGVKHYNSLNVVVTGNTFNGGLQVFPIP